MSEHDLVATFSVTRGSFIIPSAMVERAEDGDDYGLRVFIAQRLPERDDRAVLTTARRVLRDGSVEVSWRRIVTKIAPA